MDIIQTLANLVTTILLGWIWYLQRRADRRDIQCTIDNAALLKDLAEHRLDTERHIGQLRTAHAEELMSATQQFMEMFSKSSASFVVKDDFNRQVDAIFRKLDKIEEKVDYMKGHQ